MTNTLPLPVDIRFSCHEPESQVRPHSCLCGESQRTPQTRKRVTRLCDRKRMRISNTGIQYSRYQIK